MASRPTTPSFATDPIPIRPTSRSHSQYLGESDQNMSPDNHIPGQCPGSSCSVRKSSSLNYLNLPVDQNSPFLSPALWETSSCMLPIRSENDFGRLYSPSLLSSSCFGGSGSSSFSHGADGYFGATTAAPSSEGYSSSNSMSPCDFETAFCRNFYCCGITLLDLHDLLQHYEECHVQFEEEDDDEDDEDDFDSDGFGYCSHSGESEAFGEEGISGGSGGAGGFWSDSDSAMSRSPSSSSPLMLLDGFSSGSSHSESSSRRASKNRHGHGVAAAVGNLSRQQRSMFDQQLHPLYNNNNPTTHVSEAFSTSFSGSMKRKDVVSLSDLYMEEDGDDVHSSSFSSTILRASNRTDFNKSERMGPLAKHQALDENQHAAAAGAASVPMTGASFTTSNVYPVSLFPGHVILGGNGKPIGPLSSSHHHDPYPFGCPNTPKYHFSGTPAMIGTVDWMCQRDEVFSILEDMTRIPSNASDENKPYRCSVPGCDKAYKNPNGLKYHNQHGHSSSSLADADNPEARPYVCTFLECGKRYKNLNGLKYHIEHTHPNMIAALRAHQAGLLTNPSLLMANGGVYGMNHQAAAMTIAAALAAVEHSPMMAIAANAILTAHTAAAAAAAAAAATAATSSASASAGTPGDGGHETPISAQVSDLALPQVNSCRCGCSDNEWVCKPGHICGPIYHEISIPPVITPATSSMNP